MSVAQLRPEDIFTPKNDRVNPTSYIIREGVDQRFLQIVKNNRHILVTAPSGSGKTWLYKRVFDENATYTKVIDCSNVDRLGSFNSEFERHLAGENTARASGYSENKSAKVKIPIAEGGMENERSYQYYRDDIFQKFLEVFSQSDPWVIVVENLESIIRKETHLAELANLLKLLDNPEYGKFNAKFLLIGTMREIGNLFDSVADRETIVNRVTEFNNLRPMNKAEVGQFLTKTFGALGYELPAKSLSQFVDIVLARTDGVPQRLHELCYEFAILMGSEKKIENVSRHVSLASQRWVHTRFTAENATVDELITPLGTRRLELLFVIVHRLKSPYTVKGVEQEMRRTFPISVGEKKLGVSQMLKYFSDKGVLKANKNGRGYFFQDDRMRMVLRARISRDGERIVVETLEESEKLWYNKDV